MRIDDTGRKPKDQVNYRQHQRCSSCDHFSTSGVCDRVTGNISPDNVCDLWEVKSQEPKYKDKDFFVNEYHKDMNGKEKK
jgi:hypothetical protein